MSKKDKKLLNEIDAAILLKMSPKLLRWFTKNAPKAGNPRKLQFEDVEGEYFYEKAELTSFDSYLRAPWPLGKNDSRPHVPKQIRQEIKYESGYTCAMCSYPNNGEAAHIEAVATTYNNHPSNLLWLCPNHHSQYDYGHKVHADLKKEDVKFVKETRCEAQVRIWRIERRLAKPLMGLIALWEDQKEKFEKYFSGKSEPSKGAASWLASGLIPLSDAIHAQAKAVPDSAPSSYRKLAARSLVAVEAYKTDAAQLAFSLREQKQTYLRETHRVECPLCRGAGFWEKYDECPVCGGESSVDDNQLDLIDLDDYRLVTCPLCKGDTNWGDYDECPACAGDGNVEYRRKSEMDISQFKSKKCPLCKGEGIFREYDECPECGGAGSLEARHAEQVDIGDYNLVKCPACKGGKDYCSFCGGDGQVERRRSQDYIPD